MAQLGTIEALPVDVLACIFAFAPFSARLRTLSFVSKRCRLAVLRSVSDFTYARATVDLPSILSLFSSLSSLNVVRVHPTPIVLPRQLRRLTLRVSATSSENDEIGELVATKDASLPPLTFLEMFCTGRSLTPLALLNATHETLHTLVLCPGTWDLHLEDLVAAAHFPRLRELRLILTSGRLQMLRVQNLVRFVGAHSTQLTALTLSGEHSEREVYLFEQMAQISFPALRTLHLIIEDLDPVILTNLLSRSTQVTHLRLSLTDAFESVNPRLLSSLSSVHLTHFKDQSLAALATLPNLREVWPHCVLPLPDNPAVRRRLACWEFEPKDNRHRVWRVLPELTGLMELTLVHPPPPGVTLSLPRLIKLKIGKVKLPFAQVFDLIALFMRISPLRSISVVRLYLSGVPDADLAALVALIREGVAQRSLLKVKIYTDELDRLRSALAFGPAHGWLRVNTFQWANPHSSSF